MYCVFSFLTGQGAIIVNKSDFFRIRDGLEYMMSIPCLCKSRGACADLCVCGKVRIVLEQMLG